MDRWRFGIPVFKCNQELAILLVENNSIQIIVYRDDVLAVMVIDIIPILDLFSAIVQVILG